MTDTLFHNEQITIRRTSSIEDLNYVVAAELDEANRPYIAPWSFERHKQALDSEDMLHLIIEDARGSRVGFAILLGTAASRSTVELLRLVVTDKGKGFGKATIQAIQWFAFHERNARRLWLDVRERNMRARRLYESMGFRVEGTMRDACRTEAGYETLMIMSILAHEYDPALKEQDLEPEEVLDLLRNQGIIPKSSVLSSRMTGKTDGRVFAILTDNRPRFVLKYDEPVYNRNATAFLQEYAAGGWMPKVRYIDPEYRYFVYDYTVGKPGTEATSIPKWEWMGHLVRNVLNSYRQVSPAPGWGWLDEPLTLNWADFIERRVGDARRRIGTILPEDDHIAVLRLVDAQRDRHEPEAYLLHGDCGAHNFLFCDEGLVGLIDPSPMIGPPIYDALFAFCSTPDDLSMESLTSSLRGLDPRLLSESDREFLAQDVLLALYARIATCLKHGTDASGYIRAWTYWKTVAGIR
ncbi:GNAT family N-acetyltransferase [Paenibacillus thermotolerans]|uniref:GNAT family N-acetyltransferase n=1 Tax=Paenibacillus thermotolerans TaxID=3027807 RepID=UPI002368E398|nr:MULTISPECIES: GNAT family N-acetyltransferase [unclassified Paenibacillus]